MGTRSKAPPTPCRRKLHLTEDVAYSDRAQLRVDRDKGVIHGVKVLGQQSANRRRYLPECIRKAVSLYEGASVRINHPRKPTDQRDVNDVFGWLEGVHVGQDGDLYANLHILNPKSDLAESVMNAAERNPRLYGLSHNAQGEGDTVNGVFQVAEILEVRSVDLVADPATTNGLFESRGRMKLKQFLESLKLPKKVSKSGRKKLAQLFEMGAMDADMDAPMDAPPADDAPAADHEAALTDGFRSAASAMIEKALSGEMDANEALRKLKELLTSHGKLSGGGETPEVTEEEEELEEECDEDGDMKESKEYRRLKAKDRARDLCEEAGVVPSKALLEALTAVKSDDTRRALIQEHKASKSGQQPRSGSGGGRRLTEGRNGAGDEQDVGDFMASLRG